MKVKSRTDFFLITSKYKPDITKVETRISIALCHKAVLIADNKLREFGYKILHRILVTNKELKKLKIRNDDLCDWCKNLDSLEHM